MKKLILLIVSLLTLTTKAQTEKVVDNHIMLVEYYNSVNPSKEEMYSKYIQANHDLQQNFTSWKQENRFLYIKELWYYSESFYIKRNHFTEGYTLNESIIDISRFESNRKENEESIVVIPGFKDVVVLLPNNKLIYKP